MRLILARDIARYPDTIEPVGVLAVRALQQLARKAQRVHIHRTSGPEIRRFCSTWGDHPYPASRIRGSPSHLSLAAYAGQPVFLAFRYEGTNADVWAIDDVTVTTGLSAVASTPVLVNATTTFTATIAADRDATFTWNLGDGTTKAGAVVTHTYTAPGAYTAIVTATNASSQVVADTRVVAWAQVFLPLAVRQ